MRLPLSGTKPACAEILKSVWGKGHLEAVMGSALSVFQVHVVCLVQYVRRVVDLPGVEDLEKLDEIGA